jgi:2-phosphosulfolactate phosphatase
MEALVYFLPDQLHEESVRGLPVVVIDVLRAATSILTALAAGARGVIPAESLEAATELAVKLGRDDVLLCAEYDGYRVAGCDLGNSPSEYTPEAVRDRLLVMATTNGTRAILSARAAGRVLIGAYVNASRLVEALAGERRVAFVCSGHDRPRPRCASCASRSGVGPLRRKGSVATCTSAPKWTPGLCSVCCASV